MCFLDEKGANIDFVYIFFWYSRCVFLSFVFLVPGERESTPGRWRETSLKPAADPPEVSRPKHTFGFKRSVCLCVCVCVCVSERGVIIDFSEVLFNQTPRGDNTSGIMTRRSCAIYATGIVCAHLLIVGIALVVAQVFQTMIHSRLKKVSWADLHLSSFFHLSYFVTHLSHLRVVFKRVICSGQSSACSIVSPVVPAEGHRIVCF